MRKRHAICDQVEVNICDGDPINSKTFIITSKDEVYYVEENLTPCNADDCKLICTLCNECIHKFLCTWYDNAVKFNMCKHIHAVCQFINNVRSLQTAQTPPFSSPSTPVLNPPEQLNSSVNNEVIHENEVDKIKSKIAKRRKAIVKYQDLKKVFIEIARLTKNDNNNRRSFLKQLLIIKQKYSIMKKPRCSLPIVKSSSQNANIVKQKRLFSTMKKNKKKELQSKMSNSERENCFLKAIR